MAAALGRLWGWPRSCGYADTGKASNSFTDSGEAANSGGDVIAGFRFGIKLGFLGVFCCSLRLATGGHVLRLRGHTGCLLHQRIRPSLLVVSRLGNQPLLLNDLPVERALLGAVAHDVRRRAAAAAASTGCRCRLRSERHVKLTVGLRGLDRRRFLG